MRTRAATPEAQRRPSASSSAHDADAGCLRSDRPDLDLLREYTTYITNYKLQITSKSQRTLRNRVVCLVRFACPLAPPLTQDLPMFKPFTVVVPLVLTYNSVAAICAVVAGSAITCLRWPRRSSCFSTKATDLSWRVPYMATAKLAHRCPITARLLARRHTLRSPFIDPAPAGGAMGAVAYVQAREAAGTGGRCVLRCEFLVKNRPSYILSYRTLGLSDSPFSAHASSLARAACETQHTQADAITSRHVCYLYHGHIG